MSECADREELVREKLDEEDAREQMATKDARELTLAFLKDEKGYLEEDIEIDREFVVSVKDGPSHIEEPVSVDYIIRLQDIPYMAIKCSMAVESRERHILAFSRVVESMQIPYSVVTDGLKAHIIDTVSGAVVSRKLEKLPSRKEALKDIETRELSECPPAKIVGEKRILLAFECASCPRESHEDG
jgi:hypothetical protein